MRWLGFLEKVDRGGYGTGEGGRPGSVSRNQTARVKTERKAEERVAKVVESAWELQFPMDHGGGRRR